MTETFCAPRPTPASNFITTKHFAALYGAAEFSLLNGYPLASHLIINWTALGIDGADHVGAGFLTFTKCLRDFLTRRGIPPLWIYAHELGPKTGWHTHLAIFLPVETEVLRTEFMEWLRFWPVRQVGRRVPRALRMRIPKAHETKLHWLLFNYLMKGYDPTAVVQSARYAPDGKAIMLGDLISVPRRDPGITTFRKRVGFSQSLGPAQQTDGMPAAWTSLRRLDASLRLTANSPHVTVPPSSRRAFRSTFDDACYDVRHLYGAEFCEWMQGAPVVNSAQTTDDALSVIQDMLGDYIDFDRYS